MSDSHEIQVSSTKKIGAILTLAASLAAIASSAAAWRSSSASWSSAESAKATLNLVQRPFVGALPAQKIEATATKGTNAHMYFHNYGPSPAQLETVDIGIRALGPGDNPTENIPFGKTIQMRMQDLVKDDPIHLDYSVSTPTIADPGKFIGYGVQVVARIKYEDMANNKYEKHVCWVYRFDGEALARTENCPFYNNSVSE